MTGVAATVDHSKLEAARGENRRRKASLLRLSYLHGGRLAAVQVYPSGVIVTHEEPHRQLGEGGRRGEIASFSPQSRRRLHRKLVKLDYQVNQWHFVTLTYPGVYPSEPEEWKRNLRAYRAALERDWGDCLAGAIWRLERQDRGAPHYHILVCWSSSVSRKLFRTWTRETWTRILGGAPENANWVRTRVDDVQVQRDGGVTKLMHYLSKYLGKTSASGWLEPSTGELLRVGRYWGEWGKLPYASAQVYELEPETLAQLVRRLRRLRSTSSFYRSLTVDRFKGVLWGPATWWVGAMRGLSWDSSPP